MFTDSKTDARLRHFFAIKPDCSVCIYFRKHDKKTDTVIGICRRYPPQIVIDNDGDPMSLWPLVDDQNFCGEFTGAT